MPGTAVFTRESLGLGELGSMRSDRIRSRVSAVERHLYYTGSFIVVANDVETRQLAEGKMQSVGVALTREGLKYFALEKCPGHIDWNTRFLWVGNAEAQHAPENIVRDAVEIAARELALSSYPGPEQFRRTFVAKPAVPLQPAFEVGKIYKPAFNVWDLARLALP